jgi:hypothetical protein
MAALLVSVPTASKLPLWPRATLRTPVPLGLSPRSAKVLPPATKRRSPTAVPETVFPLSPTPPKVNVLLVEVDVSLRIENVPLLAVTLNEPTVRFPAESFLIPVPPEPESKTASSLTIGRCPSPQLPLTNRLPVLPPVKLLTELAACATNMPTERIVRPINARTRKKPALFISPPSFSSCLPLKRRVIFHPPGLYR